MITHRRFGSYKLKYVDKIFKLVYSNFINMKRERVTLPYIKVNFQVNVSSLGIQLNFYAMPNGLTGHIICIIGTFPRR